MGKYNSGYDINYDINNDTNYDTNYDINYDTDYDSNYDNDYNSDYNSNCATNHVSNRKGNHKSKYDSNFAGKADGRFMEIGGSVLEKIRNNKKAAAIVAVIIIVLLAAGIATFRAYEKKKEDAQLLQQQLLAAQLQSSEKENEEEKEETEAVGKIIIDVCGQVKNPGIVKLPAGSRVYEAINAAGGTTKEADTSVLNLAEELPDGVKLTIPSFEETMNMEDESYGVQGALGGNYSGNGTSTGYYNGENYGAGSKININSAGSEQLQTLTGVGPSTAQKIIDYRSQNGRFKSIEDLKNVSGIGRKTFEKMKDSITV